MQKKYVLGLDSGVTSVGWSAVELNRKDERIGLLNAGSRIFEAGMDKAETAKPVSHATERREKRLMRRQIRRRRIRMTRLRRLLQAADLLPPEANFARDIAARDKNLIDQYLKKYPQYSREQLSQILPYFIRKLALDKPLSGYELGRALYHLGQRRGFLSNRKSKAGEKDEETRSIVKKAISALKEAITATGSRTLGEYFANVNPVEKRIRGRYSSRDLFADEFERICRAQKNLIPNDLYKVLKNAIFYQRPLKSVKNLIGRCEFEPERRRAAWNTMEAQEFRIYTQVNNLRIQEEETCAPRELSENEREILTSALSGRGGHLDKTSHLTFARAKKLLGLKNNRQFSLEAGGDKKIKGHAINGKLYQIWGEDWFAFPQEKQNAILQDLRSFEKVNALCRRAQSHWGLDAAKATEFANITLEDDYCNLSLKAINILLPDLKAGVALQTAVKYHYPETFAAAEELDELPPLTEYPEIVRNPIVSRCLTEIRKVVNHLIKEYGKPEYITLELARELKNSNRQKTDFTWLNS
ncbi:MAG: hypothetical protein PHX78_12225 [bacterium]|nr:hypothetical protein [bacterium]